MSDKKLNLEHTILELGIEIYRLKNEISTLRGSQLKQNNHINGLKKLLIDSEIIVEDDLELLLDNEGRISFDHDSLDFGTDDASAKLKKASH